MRREELEKAVRSLSPKQFNDFCIWFESFKIARRSEKELNETLTPIETAPPLRPPAPPAPSRLDA